MSILNRLKIGHRLGLAFAVSIALTLAIAVYARVELSSINDDLAEMVEDRMVKVAQLGQLKDNLGRIAEATRNIVLLDDGAAMQKEEALITELRARNVELLKSLSASIRSEKGQQLLRDAEAARQAFAESTTRAKALGLQGNKDQARSLLLKETVALQASFFARLEELIAFQKELMTTVARSTDKTVDFAM